MSKIIVFFLQNQVYFLYRVLIKTNNKYRWWQLSDRNDYGFGKQIRKDIHTQSKLEKILLLRHIVQICGIKVSHPMIMKLKNREKKQEKTKGTGFSLICFVGTNASQTEKLRNALDFWLIRCLVIIVSEPVVKSPMIAYPENSLDSLLT